MTPCDLRQCEREWRECPKRVYHGTAYVDTVAQIILSYDHVFGIAFSVDPPPESSTACSSACLPIATALLRTPSHVPQFSGL